MAMEKRYEQGARDGLPRDCLLPFSARVRP